MLSIPVQVKTVFSWLSIRENLFGVCSVCDEMVSSYAQCVIKLFPCMLSMHIPSFSKIAQKSPIIMKISTLKKQNFEKPFKNPSNRTQVNILKDKFFWISLQKIWFRVCSVTAKMFELRNSGENRRKRSEIFSKIY
jgi:hypothetical protein